MLRFCCNCRYLFYGQARAELGSMGNLNSIRVPRFQSYSQYEGSPLVSNTRCPADATANGLQRLGRERSGSCVSEPLQDPTPRSFVLRLVIRSSIQVHAIFEGHVVLKRYRCCLEKVSHTLNLQRQACTSPTRRLSLAASTPRCPGLSQCSRMLRNKNLTAGEGISL